MHSHARPKLKDCSVFCLRATETSSTIHRRAESSQAAGAIYLTRTRVLLDGSVSTSPIRVCGSGSVSGNVNRLPLIKKRTRPATPACLERKAQSKW